MDDNRQLSGAAGGALAHVAPGATAAIALAILRDGFSVVETPPALRVRSAELLRLASSFFARPMSEKMAAAAGTASSTGFRAVGEEYSTDPSVADEKETFSFMSSDRASSVAHPDYARELYAAMEACIAEMDELCRPLMAELARGFGSDDVLYSPHDSPLAINFYDADRSKSETLIPLHEDGCLLTFIIGDGCGLEIRDRAGEFQACGDTTDAVVILSGRQLTLASGGAVPPTYHRVVRSAAVTARLSIAFDASVDVTRAVLPWVENETNRGLRLDLESQLTPTRFGLPAHERRA